MRTYPKVVSQGNMTWGYLRDVGDPEPPIGIWDPEFSGFSAGIRTCVVLILGT